MRVRLVRVRARAHTYKPYSCGSSAVCVTKCWGAISEKSRERKSAHSSTIGHVIHSRRTYDFRGSRRGRKHSDVGVILINKGSRATIPVIRRFVVSARFPICNADGRPSVIRTISPQIRKSRSVAFSHESSGSFPRPSPWPPCILLEASNRCRRFSKRYRHRYSIALPASPSPPSRRRRPRQPTPSRGNRPVIHGCVVTRGILNRSR